jgi:hypothetical protein
MQLITSEIQSSQSEVVEILNKLVEKDATILEKEPIQLIINFKWNSYAFWFFLA